MDYRMTDINPLDVQSIEKIRKLLRAEGIDMDARLDYSCAIYNEDYEIIATGSCYKNTLRCFAVDRRYQGEGLLNILVGHLIQRECERGYTHLFVYTKPANRLMFESLGFHEIVMVDSAVVFMENQKNGFLNYIQKLEKSAGESAAIVMNANPFTLGHQYLVEKSAKENETVHLFMVSEDESEIPFGVRKQLIMQGTAHLKNIIYHETGDYMISNATFPGYFFKDTDEMVLAHARLDVAVFTKIAEALHITRRYVGDEPEDATTATYNNVLKFKLHKAGIECVIIPRKRVDNEIISATKVRKFLKEQNVKALKKLVPVSTYNYFTRETNRRQRNMGKSLTRKIIESHYVSGSMVPGEEVFIKVDQTLTHDINAVMTYLAFEAIGIDRVRTECSVSYLDHNLLYVNNMTPDDHIYLQSVAKKYGVYVSRPGNGICHTVHVARFGVPGKISMGGDSHTPHGGSIGMLCIGVGGMDVATAMTGVPMRLKMPKVVKVNLTGKLKPGVNAKEIILEMLRRESVKGGLGKVYEYVGEGAASLEVPARATITNMGAEMGATTSIFPADEQVRKFLKAQGREQDYVELLPDEDAEYDEEININLSELVPLMSCPHLPDNVKPLVEVEKKKVQQVFIGSCTNTSYSDVAKAALVFKGHHVNEDVSCTCGIASRQTYKELLRDGYIDMLLDAGVRMLEISCGPCCAIGQTPPTNGVAVRTSNRNFKGRAGNPTAEIYLVSPESAAATAIMGTFATAEEILGVDVEKLDAIKEPSEYIVDDSMLIKPLPPEEAAKVKITRGPNIKFLPIPDVPEQHLKAGVSLKARDNVSTDDITPASAEFSSMRSNIPLMSQYCYTRYDSEFAERARKMETSIIVGGENYGQGSSREHAAINPMYLGVKCVIAKSIARIHKGNLVNHGIIPMLFEDPAAYDSIDQMDELEMDNLLDQIPQRRVLVKNLTKHFEFYVTLDLTDNEIDVVLSGGQLRFLKKQLEEEA